MIADQQGLAAVHLQSVDDVIVVVEQAGLLYGRWELHVEGVDEGIVEVDLEVQGAGELAQHIVPFGIEAGDAVGGDSLGVLRRGEGVAPFGHRFGYHHRQVGNAGYRRGVDVVEHEPELLAETLSVELFRRVRKVQLHLVVHLAAVLLMVFRVVAVAMFLYVGQQFPGLLVVRLHLGAAQLVVRQRQHEIHFVESARMHRLADGVVAQQLGREEAAPQVAGFKIVVAVDVGGYAYGRTFEVNSGEGDSLAVLVRHASAHLGRLCLTDDAEQQQKGCQKWFRCGHNAAKLAIQGE